MFQKIIVALTALFVFVSAVYGQQDTFRILQYNLLNYGAGNNPTSYKDPRLTTIIQYAAPDIFGANEIANSASLSQNILDNVLGAGWEKGAFTNLGNEIQTNMLFWKTDKFGLISQKTISYKLRDIIAFKLYYKAPMLQQTRDTIFLTVIVAHLKAGNSSQDEAERSTETQSVVNYLNSLGTNGNYIFMGDFNLYTSSEQAYGNLVNNPNSGGRLYDPINRPGKWTANASFADIHTQSTRTTGQPDGGASGGLDDRFDHMLVSYDVLHDVSKCAYLQGSYHALGQDGKHFNKSVNASPANSTVLQQVIQALYEMSDHLPVYADFVLKPAMFPAGIAGNKHDMHNIRLVNPVHDNTLVFYSSSTQENGFDITVYTAEGQVLLSRHIAINGKALLDMPGNWPAGMYLVKLQDREGGVSVKKVVKE